MPISRLPYVQHRGVEGHRGSIFALAVTGNGAILASGGSHGTQLWNVADMSAIERPSPAGIRGATMVVIWACQTDEAHDILYAGTQNGYFYCWRQKEGVRILIFEETFAIQTPDIGEVTAMAFDSTNNRLCLCTRNDFVQSWAISKDPLSLLQAFDNSQDRDIIVLGFHNSGLVYTIRGKTGETASAWSVGAQIGDTAFYWKDGVFCVDDPQSGPALFRLSDQVKSKMYHVDRERERLATLSVGSTEWVQVVTTAEVDDVSVIFAAQTRAMDCSEVIFVWKRAQPAVKMSSQGDSIAWAVKALVVLGCLAFIYQNLEPVVSALPIMQLGVRRN
ncbi:hypothetical protein C8F04DRAFT_1282562 [Mycena alexandri]|uniref:WD40 repeat-like protein n=1 Tax=Mycena alexandri TaxID=1745969 RepID=A0AAD6WPH3_9AGAR|nr:hypothetical protein C8F04DRAFT_1282562 [Mycena alexandri]